MPSMPKGITSTYATKGHWRPIQVALRLSVSEHHYHTYQQ